MSLGKDAAGVGSLLSYQKGSSWSISHVQHHQPSSQTGSSSHLLLAPGLLFQLQAQLTLLAVPLGPLKVLESLSHLQLPARQQVTCNQGPGMHRGAPIGWNRVPLAVQDAVLHPTLWLNAWPLQHLMILTPPLRLCIQTAWLRYHFLLDVMSGVLAKPHFTVR